MMAFLVPRVPRTMRDTTNFDRLSSESCLTSLVLASSWIISYQDHVDEEVGYGTSTNLCPFFLALLLTLCPACFIWMHCRPSPYYIVGELPFAIHLGLHTLPLPSVVKFLMKFQCAHVGEGKAPHFPTHILLRGTQVARQGSCAFSPILVPLLYTLIWVPSVSS